MMKKPNLLTARINARLRELNQRPPPLPGVAPLTPSPEPRPDPEPRRRPQPPRQAKKPTPTRPPDVADIDPEVYKAVLADALKDGRSKRRVPSKKRRRFGLSVSCSQEEHDLILAHCESLDLPVSEWVRRTLFRAMGQAIPSRPKRD